MANKTKHRRLSTGREKKNENINNTLDLLHCKKNYQEYAHEGHEFDEWLRTSCGNQKYVHIRGRGQIASAFATSSFMGHEFGPPAGPMVYASVSTAERWRLTD